MSILLDGADREPRPVAEHCVVQNPRPSLGMGRVSRFAISVRTPAMSVRCPVRRSAIRPKRSTHHLYGVHEDEIEHGAPHLRQFRSSKPAPNPAEPVE